VFNKKLKCMKKIFTAILLSMLLNVSHACDICGCGVGNYNPYMFPHLSHNFISIGWQYHHYQTQVFENNIYSTNREYYHTMSIAAQYSPVKNLQLMTIIPFQMNKQISDEENSRLNKAGDVIFLANYKLFSNSSCRNKNSLVQNLIIGSGIKLATGKYIYDEANKGEVGNANFQAGTGSTDFILNGYYSAQYGKFAFSSGVNYKINGVNKEEYHFGNRLQTLTQVKYIREVGRFSIIPSAGIMTEHLDQDKQDKLFIDEGRTGGYNTQALFGVDVNNKQWALGVNYSTSVKQNLAAGRINSRPGLSIHLSYSL